MKENKTGIRQRILELLGQKNYRPLDKIEIARALALKPPQRRELRNILQEMERAGEVARIRKNRYVLPGEADLVTGTLSIHQSGFGFLVTEKPGEPDIFVSAENTGTAMNGDRVVVRITREAAPAPRKDRHARAEGRVIGFWNERTTPSWAHCNSRGIFYYVVPDDPRLVHNVYVQAVAATHDRRAADRKDNRRSQTAATVGDKVVVRLDSWESRHVNPEGEIIEMLGPADAPGVDLLSIIRSYHLPTEFPKNVLDEANRISKTVEDDMIEGREDLREKFIVTIDPDDARDFDDAIDVEKIGSDGWRLGVHIADVAAYVTPGSALDREARKRGNSVYLPDRVIPMLPERLSNGVSSLNPGVNRLTHSVFIQFDNHGRVTAARFARSVIRSARRLTYKEAYAILKAPPRDQLSERLHAAWELAALLRRKAFRARLTRSRFSRSQSAA